MKLMTIIIQDKDSDNVIEALVESGHTVTRMASTGGFLRQGNVTLMVGIEESQKDQVVDLLKRYCMSTEANQYAATVFMMDMPEYLKI